jgi:GNAT superfamily N-acetyltransferase
MSVNVRRCTPSELAAIGAVINEAAEAYRGAIPADRWHEPYMRAAELEREVSEGVVFWGAYEGASLVGVMGLQAVADVALIRHAYVRPARQREGVGRLLLRALRQSARGPVLVGTWRAATWAIRFYEKHGFRLLAREEVDRVLRRYWSIPERQIEESVVLADRSWFGSRERSRES